MANIANNPFRIHVSGLARTPVESYDGGIVAEDNLGYFFWDKGCQVEAVRLMVDQSSGKCRGFGFVDFSDEESFTKALGYDGVTDTKDVQLDPLHSAGIIIKVAKPSEEHVRDKRRELAKAQDKTEELERDFRLREARVRELEREVNRARERQKALEAERCLEAQLEEQKERQDEIKKEGEKLVAAERYYEQVLRNERCRTQALEHLVTHVHDDHHKSPEGASIAEEEEREEAATPAKGKEEEAETDAPLEKSSPAVGEPQWSARLKNTFIEYYTPPMEKSPLRESSHILRSILEDKIEAEEAEASNASASEEVRKGLARGKSPFSPAERGPARQVPQRPAPQKEERAAEVEAVPKADDTGKTSSSRDTGAKDTRRSVRIRNLPLADSDELKELVYEELTRLWQHARNRPAPLVEEIDVSDPDFELGQATYAQKAMGTEARVIFVHSDDAHWLVDGRRPRNWSSSETLSILGRVCSAEWPPAPVSDWRRLRYKADTDASSNISYGTVGTRQSMSSTVAKHRTAGDGQGPVEHPAANRTVILIGISTALPTHTVQREILDLFKRLWQRDGLRFDPAAQLHRGAEGGIEVRAARRAGEENGGTCVVKLRNYADAKWLVEQARGLSIEGRPLRASWAKPRSKNIS